MLDNYNQNRYQGKKSNDPMMDWIFDVTGAEAPASNTDAAWNKLHSKIALESISAKKSTGFYLRIAASLTLLAVCAYVIVRYTDRPTQLQYASAADALTVALPDGSEVVLAPNSLISFPEKFDDTRTVNMQGEAYFDIQKSETPFIINLAEINVRVLGTAFNVDARGNEIKVMVDRGLVAMEKGKTQVKIAKGQEGIFNKQTKGILVDSTPQANRTSWITGAFTFDGTPLSSALSDLEKHYNVKFKASTALANCRITAKFNNAPLADVLEVLETILDVTISKEDDLVRIKGKGCQ